MKLCSIFVTTR